MAKKSKTLADQASALPVNNPELRKIQQQLALERKKAEGFKLLAEELERQVADYHASRFQFPKQKIAKYTGKGSYVRVAFGDTHGASLDPLAWSAFLADMEYLKPRQLIHMGDIVDCDGWLAAHHTANYVAQTDYTYSDDIIAGNTLTDQLQAACPNSEIDYIQGNHDLRVEQFCVTVAQRKHADAQYLKEKLAPEYLMRLEQRGIRFWNRGEAHDGCAVAGTIKRGKCYFTHPSSSSKNHAAAMVASFGANVVYGHTHRCDFYPGSDVKGDEFAAWSPGCLCVKRKYWHHTNHFKHNQGYHLQLVRSDETFLGINVPIINGESYLRGLLNHGSGK